MSGAWRTLRRVCIFLGRVAVVALGFILAGGLIFLAALVVTGKL